ncbi:DUF6273 domain-containing protein [Lactococcus petauri]|uniref:DUF6273 domain-containing protein n=1 Tax=Lactococcus petauri TaxID=1940789 RepID=UPI000621AC28|nr:DUF6273 domain-containing protein [Lactococcus petauri]KKF91761.1 hypothetical protein YA68_01655 [Lactococcus garvieae]MDG6136468.1 DUF6273 domain-containing protein [Lactococcus petauri]MDT2551977.1 DUF6273 domain-containing protein [Lactococcus petauri]MDT2562193.1 DUF6273 domain-containing protein [Lactococcus petauri]MDT2575010.1 DUF6273 domain-containing protein [Lactococcus petauri]
MKSKKKMMMFLVLSLLQILIAVFIVVKREDFIYLLPAKEPQVLRDLAYDKDKRLGYTIHIKEEGKLVPYLVLTKNYINQGNVLLLRKYLLDPPMPFQEGWKRFYYGHSMIDAFMNKEFINRLTKNVQENIPLIELGIKALKPNFESRHIDKIKRKLFLLSDIDVGNFKQRILLEEEENLLYFKRKDGDNTTRLAFLEGDLVAYTWWLRTAFATDSVVAKTIDDGMFSGNGVVYPAHVRPAFRLPPETEVEEKEINGHKEYVLKIDK